MVERAHGKSRGLARCLPGELHPPRRRLCKDGATSATRDRSPDRADIVPLKRRGCRARSLEAYCRRGFIISRRIIDVHCHLASVPDRGRRCLQPGWRVTQRANFITDRFVPKPTHTGSTADGRRLQDSSPTGRDLRPPSQPSHTARDSCSDPDPGEDGADTEPRGRTGAPPARDHRYWSLGGGDSPRFGHRRP